jgi:uncharacterized membrane protein YvlD (DUF360 family)
MIDIVLAVIIAIVVGLLLSALLGPILTGLEVPIAVTLGAFFNLCQRCFPITTLAGGLVTEADPEDVA